MIRDLVSSLDYSDCAELALGMFFIAFAGILLGALRLSRSASDRFASIPLSDAVEDPFDE